MHSQQVLHGNAHQVQLHVSFCGNLLDVPKAINVGQDLEGKEVRAKRRESRQAQGITLKPKKLPCVGEYAGIGRLHPQQHFILVLREWVARRPEHKDRSTKPCSLTWKSPGEPDSPLTQGRLETDPIQSVLIPIKHTDLLRGEIPLGVEEVILVLGEDGDIILLHDGGVRALLDHLQVDGV